MGRSEHVVSGRLTATDEHHETSRFGRVDNRRPWESLAQDEEPATLQQVGREIATILGASLLVVYLVQLALSAAGIH